MTRVVEVPTGRLPRWLDGFAERHGGAVLDGGALVGADGAVARFVVWAPVEVTTTAELPAAVEPPHRLGVLLIRRGGYAVALAEGDALVTRKVGRRHVQSRTAAGGWSQQRFARRRGNQADELVAAVQGHAVRLLAGERLGGVVLGGDRRLVADVLADARIATLATLPRRELYDLPDPTPAVLETALARARSVRIELTD